MSKLIKLDTFTVAFKASALGSQIQKGIYTQVGMIRTLYKRGTSETKSVEAVLLHPKTGKLFAVEQHRGLAISTVITDPSMLKAMGDWLNENDITAGEGFVYDQVIEEGVEEIERTTVAKAIELLPEEDDA